MLWYVLTIVIKPNYHLPFPQISHRSPTNYPTTTAVSSHVLSHLLIDTVIVGSGMHFTPDFYRYERLWSGQLPPSRSQIPLYFLPFFSFQFNRSPYALPSSRRYAYGTGVYDLLLSLILNTAEIRGLESVPLSGSNPPPSLIKSPPPPHPSSFPPNPKPPQHPLPPPSQSSSAS